MGIAVEQCPTLGEEKASRGSRPGGFKDFRHAPISSDVSKSCAGVHGSAPDFSQVDQRPAGEIIAGEVYGWEEVHRRNVWHQLNQDTWLSGQAHRARLQRQSEEIANRLERLTGESYRRKEEFTLVDLITGEAQRLPGFRNSNLIPAIARPKRQRMATDLEMFLWLMEAKGILARYWVFTSGVRCSASEMRARRAALGRAITLLRPKLLRKYGLEIIFKGLENPVDTNGQASWHVHANLVVLQRRNLNGQEWKEVNRMVSDQLGAWWKDNGVLKETREVCKYVTKIEDLEKIEDSEFLGFAQSIEGARLYATYGAFQEWRKTNEERGLRPRKLKKGDDFVWTYERKRGGGSRKESPYAEETYQGPQVVAVTAPCPAFSNVLRPCVIVRAYRGDFEAIIRESPQAREALAIAASVADRSHLHLNSTGKLDSIRTMLESRPKTRETRLVNPRTGLRYELKRRQTDLFATRNPRNVS